MSTLHIFKSTFPNINYVFRNGKQAIFRAGLYHTNIAAEIAELTEEAGLGHPHIFIDPNEKEIDSLLLNPMEALKAKLREEILAEQVAAQQAAAGDASRDMGKSDAAALKPSNTSDISQAAAGGSGVALTARLSTLKV